VETKSDNTNEKSEAKADTKSKGNRATTTPKASKNGQANQAKKSFSEKITEFFTKYKVVVLGVLIAIVVILVGIGVYSYVSNSNADKSARAMEEVRTKLTAWSAETDQAKKDESEKEIQSDLDAIIKQWPHSFAAQESLYTKSTIATTKKDWPNAEKFAAEAADRLPKTYLAPIALEAAAVAAEEQGSTDKAIEYYNRIVSNYKEDTPNLAHAYFALGRLAESKSDWKTALGCYDKLLSDFPDSDWAKLAKDRVVYLKATGHADQNQ